MIEDIPLQHRLLDLAPGVLFLHTYFGTCISGTKCNQWPEPRPCGRRFGPACLARYFPLRCGGWNPVTMLRMYSQQTSARALLNRFSRIVTHSGHMREELVRNGVEAERVEPVSFFVPKPLGTAGYEVSEGAARSKSDALQILFVGRADPLKGGALLIDALPLIAHTLSRPVHLTMACDGAAMEAWGRLANRCRSADSRVRVEFTGWLGGAALSGHYQAADILAVPSVWPEPFGQVGVEAGFWGLPAVAFDSGGIRDWLTPGVNGELAPADPPSVEGLRDAICRCLQSEAHYRSLRVGAARSAVRFGSASHLDRLLSVFSGVARKPGTRPQDA